jgi:hypothetical protein
MSDSTITNDTKKKVLQEEISMWKNTSYLWTIRIKVAKKIEDKALESNAMIELEKCEKSLDLLNEELKSL